MNYYTDRENRNIERFDLLYNVLAGRVNGAVEPLECDFVTAAPAMLFNRIKGYRKAEDDEKTFALIKGAVGSALASAHSENSCVAYFLVSDGFEKKVFYAGEKSSIANRMGGFVPDLGLENSFISMSELRGISAFGGVITGAFKYDDFIADKILEGMNGLKGIVAIISRPVSTTASGLYKNALYETKDMLDSYSQVGRSYSSDSHSFIKTVFSGKAPLEGLVSKHIERFEKNFDGLWETAIYFGGDTQYSADSIGNIVVGALNSCNKLFIQEASKYFIKENPLGKGKLAFPVKNSVDLTQIPQAFRKSELTSYLTGEELASVMQLPSRSHMGIDVIDLYKTASSVHPFDVLPVNKNKNGFTLGHIIGSGFPYRIYFDDTKEHTLITGGSGGGKTTTTFNIIEKAHEDKIPFCVIESAKKTYWHLCDTVKDLKVYSAGMDGLPLRFNPLEPEDGVIIGNFVDGLIQSFAGAFRRAQDETAVYAHLRGLILYVYEKFGWSSSAFACKGVRAYPTLWDLKRYNQEYSEKHNTSGSEVKQNIDAAVMRRLDMLTTGIVSTIFDTTNSVTAKDLCEHNSVVELDDLKGEMRPLVAGLLVDKISSYVRQKDHAEKVRNLLILEEAHNVIGKVSDASSSAAVASEYFCSLLSEIREYGMGIVIADQCASQINPLAIANTKVKIMHRLSSDADFQAEAFAFNLNDFQKRLIPSLGTGEAIIAVGGEEKVCKIKVLQKKTPDNSENCACVLCNRRHYCGFDKTMVDYNIATAMFVDRVLQNRYNNGLLKATVDQYFDATGVPANSRLCNLGYILTNTNISLGELEKRRILYQYAF